MFIWDAPEERYYHHGLDRGVIYLRGKAAVPWSGLISCDEGGETEKTVFYHDGQIFYTHAEPTDYSAKLTALYFPDEFGELVGIAKVADGLYADNQISKRFDLSYRTLVGSGMEGDRFGYQIHLVYNALASISSRSRKTMGDSPEAMEFNFDLGAIPVKMEGKRPTSHYVIDTRGLSPDKLAEIEAILYGGVASEARMPTPTELYELMNYGPEIIVRLLEPGYFSIEGSSENVVQNNDGTWTVHNINATIEPDGLYTISDGDNTTIIE